MNARAVDVGLDASAQPVDRVVGQPHGILVLARVGDDGEHRPEDLLLGDAHVVGADEDGGLVEEALVEALRPLAPGQELGALFHARGDVALDPLALLLADQWPEDGGRIPGIADLITVGAAAATPSL